MGGIGLLLFYAVNPKNGYISENALAPGISEIKFANDETREALIFTEKYRQQQKKMQQKSLAESQWSKEMSTWISQRFEEQGHETYLQPFKDPTSQEDDVYWNVIAILRADKSDGKESMVLSTNYEELSPQQLGESDALSGLGLCFSMLNYLSEKIEIKPFFHTNFQNQRKQQMACEGHHFSSHF